MNVYGSLLEIQTILYSDPGDLEGLNETVSSPNCVVNNMVTKNWSVSKSKTGRSAKVYNYYYLSSVTKKRNPI